MSYKKLILRLTPAFVHGFVRDVYFAARLAPNAIYDAWRFLRYSGLNRSRAYRSERAARIVLFYHQVEKGLSLASPRPGFGAAVVARLLDDVDAFVGQYGAVAPATTAMAALQAYVDFNERAGHDASAVRERLGRIAARHGVPDAERARWVGGARAVTRATTESARASGFAALMRSRHSIRHFAGGQIPREQIRQAVALAQSTPSVCNRQSWRVHLFDDAGTMQKLLRIQAGNRGFGEQVSALLVITADLGCFMEVGERYQAWIDGGMFAMSLCLALHDAGYGNCCLNWSKERDDDRALHEAGSIALAEQIIMLLAVGILPERLNVACSYRPPVDDGCLSIH